MTATEKPQTAARRLAAPAIRDEFKLETLHVYRDEAGDPIYWRIRAKHKDGRKWIRPMRLNGHGYELGEPHFTDGKPLYHLPNLAKRSADPVFVVEGETCVNVLLKLGVLATTSGAADSAGKSNWQPLAGRVVTIWPDNDEAGTRYADEVEEQLLPIGCTVRRVDVAVLNLPNKGDVVNWLEANPTATAADVAALPLVGVDKTDAVIADPWPDPKPIAGDFRPELYPLDALPAPIRAAVEEVQSYTQAPVALVAASALSALSTAGQGIADVARSEHLCGPIGLYLLTIAESGERKSTADSFFARAIRKYEAREAEAAQPKIRQYAAAHTAWEAEKSGVEGAIKKAAQRGDVPEELRKRLADLEQREPRPLRYARILRGDVTQEALAFALAEQWPCASLNSAEAGTIFGSYAMGRDSVVRFLSTLNSLWTGEALRVGRRTSESFTVSGARLTVGLQVQPAVLQEFTERHGDLARGAGFYARFLVSAPETTQGTRFYRDEPPQWPALDRFDARIGALLADVRTGEDGALELTTLTFSSSAFGAWRGFHDAIERDLAPGGELEFVRDVASKAADNVARLAALFHLFEHGRIGPVESDVVESASRIVAWHLNESRRFFGMQGATPEQRDAVDLEAWLVARCREQRSGRIGSRAVLQYVTPTRLRIAAARDEAIEVLVALGRARWVDERRQRFVEINPVLLGDGGDA